MGVYQIIYLVLLGIGLLIDANSHGKPRLGDYNFFGSLVARGLMVFILFEGGFFK